jgi:hypothetical protein
MEGEDPRQPLTSPDPYWSHHNRLFHPHRMARGVVDEEEEEEEGDVVSLSGHSDSGTAAGGASSVSSGKNSGRNSGRESDGDDSVAPHAVDFGPLSHLPFPLPAGVRIFESPHVRGREDQIRHRVEDVLKRSSQFTGSRPVAMFMGPPQTKIASPKRARRAQQEEADAAARQNFWIGARWLPAPMANPLRSHTSWLPNDRFCSSHIALCCEFEVVSEHLSSEWA